MNTFLFLAAAAVLALLAVKIVKGLIKILVWIVVLILVIVVVNYKVLPRIGKTPVRLGMEKVFKVEKIDQAKEKIKAVLEQKDKITEEIVPKIQNTIKDIKSN